MSDLESYLKGGAPEATPEVPVEAPAETQETTPERPRDEQGRFAKGEEKPAVEAESAPPAPEKPKVTKPPEVSGLEAGIAAERNKRQEAERKAFDLEARLRALETKANPPPPPPDPVADPQGFTNSFQQQLQMMAINQKVDTSAMLARAKYEDFDQVLAEWNGLIQKDQSLYFQAIQQPHPADWAYQHVKRQQLLSEVGSDPSAYKQRVIAEARAQWEAEQQQRPASPPPPPPSLASTRSNGRVSEPVWNGPPSLSTLFKPR